MQDATRRQFLGGASAAIALAPAVAAAQGSAAAAGPSQAASRLAARLFAGQPAPALSLAVASSSGSVLWTEALGNANLELGIPATAEHRFPLGSISKVLTSTAAARLAGRGVLDLDAPIARQLPGLPPQHNATTLRQLLTHRGGIRHYMARDFDLSGPGGAVYMRLYPTANDVLALFITDPLVAAPGAQVSYSSYGYTLASMAMEAAAGTGFRQLILAEIGEAFGLASLAADDPFAIVPQRAAGYMNAQDIALLYRGVPEAARPQLTAGWANMPFSNPGYSWAGAGFLMSPSDTARFGAALIAGPASRLGAAERTLLFTPMTAAAGDMPPLGLGWRIDTDGKARARWHHAGATPGGRYALAIYPEQQLSVAIAGNVMSMRLDVMRVASDLVDVFAQG